MKRIVSILLIVMMLGAVLAFAGCKRGKESSDDSDNTSNVSPLNGTYILVEMITAGGDDFDSAELDSMGMSITMIINGDTVAAVSTNPDGSSKTATSSVDRENSRFVDADGATNSYILDGNRIYVTREDSTLVFEKQ